MRWWTSSVSSTGARRIKVADRIARAVLLVLGGPVPAVLAHDGAPLAPQNLWSAWNWEPTVLLGMALVAWAYARGVRVVRRRAGPGRGPRGWQTAAFAGGLAVIFVALISPLDALGSALLSAHMVQHLGLILIAAPLLVLGAPLAPLLWGLPKPVRRVITGSWLPRAVLRRGWQVLGRPLVVWTFHTATMWIWHLPSLYQAALQSQLVHAVEHAGFLSTALLFWWTVARAGRRGRLGYGAGVLYVLGAGLQSSMLGIFMTFAEMPWYPAYTVSVAAWGLTPLVDQQLAGLIMWVPAGLIYLHAALVVFAVWLKAEEESLHPGRGWAKATRGALKRMPTRTDLLSALPSGIQSDP